MMAQKARLFHDPERYTAILRASGPRECKDLGRRVTPFDPGAWDAVKYETVKTANRAKFGQNPDLRETLLGTGGAVLAEASPYDTVWGIGLDAAGAARLSPSEWPGQNLLGRVLMDLRTEFSAERSAGPRRAEPQAGPVPGPGRPAQGGKAGGAGNGKYKVITLCGSTRFKDAFMEAQKRLTLAGSIVISVGLFGHSGDREVWEGMSEDTMTGTKRMLDDMHKAKIDMADEIFVINVGGYIGASTRSEIAYAEAAGKPVHYLEE